MPAGRLWTLLFLVVAVISAPGFAQPQGSGRATVSTQLSASALQPGKDALLAVVLDLADGFHAQSNRPKGEGMRATTVKLEPNPALEFGTPSYPPGKDESYPELGVGTLNVYVGKAVIFVPVKAEAGAPLEPATIKGSITYQICDEHMCFQPETTPFEQSARIVAASEAVSANAPELFANYKPASVASSAQRADATSSLATTSSQAWSVPFAFGAAFLAGLLFNVMPCVLPVLPLKAAGFYRAAEHNRAKSVMLGLSFSLGIVAVFAVLAILVLVLRKFSWGEMFSNAYFVWFIVGVLIVCAFGLFGSFTINLPPSLYAVDPRQDTVGGNIVFGAFTAILAAPCTAPLLPPLLLWATSKPASLGVPAVIIVGIGMAFPYLILSATPELARRFPRTGAFGELFKQMMGFMLLAAASYFAGGRLVHGVNFWWIVVAVVAVAALFLLARTVQLTKNAFPVAVSSALAVAMFGGILFWTARITGLTAPMSAGSGTAQTAWHAFSDSEFAAARESGKGVLVKFTANWCTTCQVIEGTVYRQQAVWDELNREEVVAFKVDLTDSDAPGKDLLLQLNPAGGIPLTAIYPPHAQSPVVLSSIYSAETLLETLKRVMQPAEISTR